MNQVYRYTANYQKRKVYDRYTRPVSLKSRPVEIIGLQAFCPNQTRATWFSTSFTSSILQLLLSCLFVLVSSHLISLCQYFCNTCWAEFAVWFPVLLAFILCITWQKSPWYNFYLYYFADDVTYRLVCVCAYVCVRACVRACACYIICMPFCTFLLTYVLDIFAPLSLMVDFVLYLFSTNVDFTRGSCTNGYIEGIRFVCYKYTNSRWKLKPSYTIESNRTQNDLIDWSINDRAHLKQYRRFISKRLLTRSLYLFVETFPWNCSLHTTWTMLWNILSTMKITFPLIVSRRAHIPEI